MNRMPVRAYPFTVAEALMRRGLQGGEVIDPSEAFDEYVAYRIGPTWGPELRRVYAQCNLAAAEMPSVVEQPDEYTPWIEAACAEVSGRRDDLLAEAMAMVNARVSRVSLAKLVVWLLLRAEEANARVPSSPPGAGLRVCEHEAESAVDTRA